MGTTGNTSSQVGIDWGLALVPTQKCRLRLITQGLSDSSRSTARAILSSIQELTLAHMRDLEVTLASCVAWVPRLRLHYQFHPLFFLSSKLETTVLVAYNPNERGWKRIVANAGPNSPKTNERLRKWRYRMMKKKKTKKLTFNCRKCRLILVG